MAKDPNLMRKSRRCLYTYVHVVCDNAALSQRACTFEIPQQQTRLFIQLQFSTLLAIVYANVMGAWLRTESLIPGAASVGPIARIEAIAWQTESKRLSLDIAVGGNDERVFFFQLSSQVFYFFFLEKILNNCSGGRPLTLSAEECGSLNATRCAGGRV